MKQIWLVTKREFLVQVRKKSFVLLTIFTPLLMVGLIAVVVLLSEMNRQTDYIAIVDESGLFTTTFQSSPDNIYAFYPAEDLQGLKDTLIGSEYMQAVLHIPKTDSTFESLRNGIELSSNKNFGVIQISSLQSKISNELERINLSNQGISEEDLAKARFPITLRVQKETTSGISETSQISEGVKTVLSYVLMYATFMFIMIYAVRVMRSVIEEKNNRVVEIIISSVKPFNLMLGKIMGTTFVALTQFIIWIIIILILMSIFPLVAGGMTSNMEMMSEVSSQEGQSLTQNVQMIIDVLFGLNYPLIIFSFLIYFFFGYLLYSSFFAAIGASVDNETETQQFMWVGLAPLMLGVYGAISVIENPDGPVGFWMSMIPFTSPIAMMARISYGVSTWELILSIVILLITVFAMVWFAAKIYRIGILMYGKKPSFKEWLRWIRY